jgi:hypothetical protein
MVGTSDIADAPTWPKDLDARSTRLRRSRRKPRLVLEEIDAPVELAEQRSTAYELTAQTVRSLSPMVERHGVTTSSEVRVDTLAARLGWKPVVGDGVIMPPPMLGA